MLDNICESLLEKYNENKLNFSFEPEYETPAFHKQSIERFSSSTTFESEAPNFEFKTHRERVGNDLKQQWTQMMKEFEQSAKKQIAGMTPIASEAQ